MSFLPKLPREICDAIIALAMPLGVTIAPCMATSPLATEKIPKLTEKWPPISQTDKDIVFRKLTIREDYAYAYDEAEAQACTGILLTNRELRHDLAPQFYRENNFAFPGGHFLRLFICSLSETTLSFLRIISISFLIKRDTWESRGVDVYTCHGELLWSQLSCLRKCGNLERLHISLGIKDCGDQAFLFDRFLQHGRETIGMAPNINVAFTSCGKCQNPEKSQHWRWASGSGSQEWNITHFIGTNPVQTLSQILAANPVSNDPALKASSIAKIKKIGADIKLNRSCETCGGYPAGMPDDLRFSRGYWCKYCELVVFCRAHSQDGTLRLASLGHADGSCTEIPRVETPAKRQARWVREDKKWAAERWLRALTLGD